MGPKELKSIELITEKLTSGKRVKYPRSKKRQEGLMQECDAIIKIYRREKSLDQISIRNFKPRWHCFRHDYILEDIEEIADVIDPNVSLVVSFGKHCSYTKRVNLLHLLGISEIEKISVDRD